MRLVVCVGCPKACVITVKFDNEGNPVIEKGESNFCKKGEEYVYQELQCPSRILTTTMRVKGGGLLPVRTNKLIPRDLMKKIAEELKAEILEPPIGLGEVVFKNIFNEVDVVSCGVCKNI